MRKLEYNKIIPIIALVISVILVAIIFVDLAPLISELFRDSHDESKMIDYIHAYGIKGAPILLSIQFLMTLIPFLPSAPVQILAGLCYGVWFGSLICVIGIILSNCLMFYLLREFEGTFSKIFHHSSNKVHDETHESLSDRIKNPDKMALILYLIPVIPSAILPIVFAKTKISFPKFFVGMSIGSIPVTMLYTWFGEKLSKGDYTFAIVLACVIVVLLITFFFLKKKLLKTN